MLLMFILLILHVANNFFTLIRVADPDPVGSWCFRGSDLDLVFREGHEIRFEIKRHTKNRLKLRLLSELEVGANFLN